MDSPADGANAGIVGSSGIERGVGWLMLALGVVLFFCLVVAGMGRVEKISTDTVRSESDIQTVSQDQSEIGGLQP